MPTALTLAVGIEGLKQAYSAYTARHPGSDTLNTPVLAQVESAANALRSALTAAGFGGLASESASEDAAQYQATMQGMASALQSVQVTASENAALAQSSQAYNAIMGSIGMGETMGSTAAGYNAGTAGTSASTYGGGTIQSAGSAALGFAASVGNFINALTRPLTHPGSYGASVGSGLQAAGTGAGAGLASGIDQVSASGQTASQRLLLPILAVVGGLVVLDVASAKRRRRR